MTKTKSLLAKFWKLAPSLIFVFAICAIFSDWTFAATNTPAVDFGDLATAKSSLPLIKTETLGFISHIVKFIAYLTYVFSIFVGNLMDSSLIVDSGMGNTLHQIWSLMRNFVNVAFILVLLIIAVMVIFGGGGEKGLGMLKKVLPKFILALVLVNLTFFLARFVLTTNDVLTTAIMTVPETIAPEKMVKLPCASDDIEECRSEILENMAISSREDFKKKLGDSLKYLADLKEYKLAGSVGKENITLVLTTYMLNLENLVKINALGGNWDAFLGSIGAIVTAAIVGLVIFMLFLALIVRMVVLWIAIALSPVAALAMVLGEVIPGMNTKGDFDLLGIFLKHAFMPALISIPLVIGLVMIFANNAIGYNISLDTFFSFSGDSAADNLFSLLWWIASIIVIWYGTNTMIKKSSDYATKMTEKVHSGVNKFVGGAASTLQYVPFLPTENKDGSEGPLRSMASYTQIPGRIQSLLSGQAGSRAGGDAQHIAEEHLRLKPTPLNNQTFNVNLKRAKIGNINDLAKALHELVKQNATSDNTVDKPTAQTLLSKYRPVFEKIGITKQEQLENKSLRELLTLLKDRGATEAGGALKELKKIDDKFKVIYAPTDDKEARKATTEKKTNIPSEVAGQQVLEKKELDNLKSTKKKDAVFEIDNRPVFEQNGTYYFANDNEDVSKGAEKLFTEEEKKASFDGKIEDLDNDLDVKTAGTTLEKLLEELSKSEALLSTTQKKMIDGKITEMFGKGRIHEDHFNDVRAAYKKVFKNTNLVDGLKDKSVSD